MVMMLEEKILCWKIDNLLTGLGTLARDLMVLNPQFSLCYMKMLDSATAECFCLPKFKYQSLIPSVMVFEGVVFGINYIMSGASLNGISAPIRRDTGTISWLCEDIGRR